MGFFGIFKDKKNRDLESENVESKKHSLMDAALGTGDYKKTEEELAEKKEVESLKGRIGELRIKRYKSEQTPTYDDNKKRLKIGQSFNLKNLPELIYKIANRSGDFRRDIGGRFDLKDRDELKFVMKHNRYAVSKMKQKLNHRDEGKCKVDLSGLF